MTSTDILDLKERVRARDGFCCIDCGMSQDENIERHDRKLEVHRQIPGTPYTETGCVSLCQECHKNRHRGSTTILGNAIREARQAAGLTQWDLAGLSGVTMSAVSKIEQGDVKEPRFFTVVRIAHALGASQDEWASRMPPVSGA